MLSNSPFKFPKWTIKDMLFYINYLVLKFKKNFILMFTVGGLEYVQSFKCEMPYNH